MPELIFAPPKDCPNCNAPEGFKGEGSYVCPECNREFCSQCFDFIIGGDGHQIKCPICKAIIDLPLARYID